MADQAVLEERIEHLQNDVTELRKDIRRLDDKIDGVRKEVAEQRTGFAAAIGALDAKQTAQIGAVETKLIAAMGAMEVRLITWMIGTALACAGIGLGVARLFR